MLVALLLILPAGILASPIEEYAPVIKYNMEETFFATPIDFALNNSNLIINGTIIDGAPIETSIMAPYSGPDYYITTVLGDLGDIEEFYSANTPKITYYARKVDYGNGTTALQYWFYYPYDDGSVAKHEGDWEMVTFLFENGEPVWAAYMQDNSGQRLAWDAVEKQNGNPVLYPAKGSHTSYFHSYNGQFGLRNDEVAGNGDVISPEKAEIFFIEEDNASNKWLLYGGRWGKILNDTSPLSEVSGPFGPPHIITNKDAWDDPAGWAMEQKVPSAQYEFWNWFLYNLWLFFLIFLSAVCAWKLYHIPKIYYTIGLQVDLFFSNPFKKPLVIGIIAMAVLLLGVGLSWYDVSINITGGRYGAGESAHLVSFGGINGLSVNGLGETGMVTVFNFPIPFGLIFIGFLVVMLLDVVVAKSGQILSRHFLSVGVLSIIIFLLIISVFSSLEVILPADSNSMVLDFEADLIPEILSKGVFGGTESMSLGGQINATVNWGVGIGMYLFLLGGIVCLASGIFMHRAAGKMKFGKRPYAGQSKDMIVDMVKAVDPECKYFNWKNHDFIKFVKYGLVSLFASILNLILLYAFTNFVFGSGLTPLFFSLLCSTVFSYALNHSWGFSDARLNSNGRMFAKYVALNVATFALNMGIFSVLLSWDVNYLLSEVVAMLLVFGVNFIGSHKWVFKT